MKFEPPPPKKKEEEGSFPLVSFDTHAPKTDTPQKTEPSEATPRFPGSPRQAPQQALLLTPGQRQLGLAKGSVPDGVPIFDLGRLQPRGVRFFLGGNQPPLSLSDLFLGGSQKKEP